MTREPPSPDVVDPSGRMRRLAISLGLGIGAAVLAYILSERTGLTDMLDGDGGYAIGRHAHGLYKIACYIAVLAGAGVFTIALVIQNHLAKKTWRQSLVAKARIVER